MGNRQCWKYFSNDYNKSTIRQKRKDVKIHLFFSCIKLTVTPKKDIIVKYKTNYL